jgi:pSer/pThr/pTyr-binding forkhead associated (FHA) protein
MNACPHCMHDNYEGVFFCEECGRLLHGQTATTMRTRQFEPLPLLPMEESGEEETMPMGQEVLLVLLVRDAAEPLIFEPTDRLVLGRTDRRRSERPDVDLTVYSALEKGVSRVHAAIERRGHMLALIDLGSSNGTFLNSHRLRPQEFYALREGDEVILGRLVIHVYFKSNVHVESGL